MPVRSGPRLKLPVKTALSWCRERLAYCLSVLPFLTDWLDTGHWPHHPRELANEFVIGWVILFGVHRMRKRADRFRVASETDALTGLGNRHRFRADVERQVSQATSQGTSVSLAFIDVDRFKQINDSGGHEEGDRALREVAAALARSVREGVDACYRLGGDEFAVLVSGVEAHQAMAALRRGFARIDPAWLALSCSVGAVSLRAGEGADAWLRRADALMYAAKRGETSAQAEGLSDTLRNTNAPTRPHPAA